MGKSKRIIIVSAVFIVLGLGLIALSQLGYPNLTGNLRDYFKYGALVGGLVSVAVGLVFLIYAFFSKLKSPARNNNDAYSCSRTNMNCARQN